MGMFDSFRIRAFESNIEIQTKDFENTLENYYFLSKVFNKEDKNNFSYNIENSNNISFLQEYIIDEYGEDNEFLICFKNGIFVDFCFLGKNKNLSFKEIQKIKESLALIWSDNNFFSDLLMIKNDISDYNYNLTSHYLVKYKNLVNSANDYYENKKENNISNKNNKLNKAQKILLNFFEEINNPLYDYITKKYKKLNVFFKEESQRINKKNYTKKDSLIPISIDKSLSDSLPEEESKIYDENLFNYEKNINDLFYKYYINLKNKNNPNLLFNHSFTFMYYDILEKIKNNNIKIEDINNFIILGGNILDIINKYEKSVSLDIINNTILNNLENILSYGDTNYINYLIENKSNINEIDIINSVNKVYQYVTNYKDNAEYNKYFINIKTSLFEMVTNLKQSNTYYIQNDNKNIFDIFLENEINYYKKQKQKDKNIVLLYSKFTNKLFEYLFVNDKLCYYQDFNNFQKLIEDISFENIEITTINTIEKLNHLKQKIEQNYLSNKLIKSSKSVTKSKI